MTPAQEALAEGLAALDEELGESFVLAASDAAFTARLLEEDPKQLPDYAGVIRETVLCAARDQAAFADGLPAAGAIITRPDGASARVARIAPAKIHGWVNLVLADEFA